MDKLYLYLLNRNPTRKEIYNNRGKSFKLINTIICQSEEYKYFMKNNYDILEDKLLNILELKNSNNIHKDILVKLYNFYRYNNYSDTKLEIFLNEKKTIYKEYLINLFKNIFFIKISKNKIDIYYNIFIEYYINNNFNIEFLDSKIILSSYFHDYIEKYLKNFIN